MLYQHEARRKLEQGGILFPDGPVDTSDARMIAHPPGYSILMAAVYSVFGERDSALRLAQILCDAAAAVALFFIAVELLPVGVGIIAGMLAALSPHFASYSILLLPDSLVVLPILLSIYFFIRASKQPRLGWVLAAGAMAGLSCWFRSNGLLLAPFLALLILLLFERGKRLRLAIALVAAAFAVISPITIRNWVIYHQFIPLSLGAGNNLIEGIADYDKERRFGLPMMDTETVKKDAEWHNRPDYARHLWVPDGITRDRYRFARGLEVIRSNPGWFFTVMLRRMWFMLRYNDFLPQNRPLNTTLAAEILAAPNFGHDLTIPEQALPVWSSDPERLLDQSTIIAPQAKASPARQGRVLEIVCDNSEAGDQLVTEAIAIEKNTDYLLTLPIELKNGAAAIKIKTPDPRITLASAPVPQPDKKKKRKAKKASLESGSPASTIEEEMTLMRVPFASGEINEARITLANDRPKGESTVVQLGRVELFELGRTPNLWTRYPRALLRGLQKNIFKTERLLPLILIGALALALLRRGRALAILLAVPLYYLCIHSALHTEYRYILAMHHFLFVMGAVSLYLICVIATQAARRVRAARSGAARGS